MPCLWRVPTPLHSSYSWSPSRKLAGPSWNCGPPLLVWRLVVVRNLSRSLRVRLPLRIPPHWIIRTPSSILPEHAWRFVPPCFEIILRSHARAGIRPRGIPRRHRILLPEIWIGHPVQIARPVDWPPAPLPLLRTIAHERAPVAARCNKHVWAFAGDGVFEATPSARTFSITGAGPVVPWTEFGGHACATLVPAFVPRVVFDERYFACETAARAKVV